MSAEHDPGAARRALSPGWLSGLVGTLVLAALSPWFLSSGHLSIDEGIYHLMTRAMTAGDGLALQTGYEQLPFPELLYLIPGRTAHTQVVDGQVVAQYPFGFAVLAAGPYALWGSVGMMLVNLLASAVAIGLCAELTFRLTERRRVAYLAAMLLAAAGFWFDYSFAMWPHLCATTLWLAGIFVLAAGRETPREAIIAGLLIGVATCVRLDVIVLAGGVVGALALPPTHGRRLAAFGGGLVPPLLILAATNLDKFGSFNPLSYGSTIDARTSGTASYRYVLVLLSTWYAVTWLAVGRISTPTRIGRRSLAVGVGVAALLTFALRDEAWELLRGTYTLLVDLAVMPAELAETRRLDSGALVYGSAIKKAFLQSCPHALAVGCAALASWRRGSVDLRRKLQLLYVPVGALALFYASRSWHGGASLNMRYFVPLLPVLAIATALVLAELAEKLGKRERMVVTGLISLAVLGAGGATWALTELPLAQRDPYVRLVPLTLAAFTALGMIGWLRWPSGKTAIPALVGLGLSAAWAFGVGNVGDLRQVHEARRRHAVLVEDVVRHVQPEAVVITQLASPMFGLLEHDGIWLASAQSDRGESLGEVARSARRQGLRVYLVLPLSQRTRTELRRRLPDWKLRAKRIHGGYGIIEPVDQATR